MRYPALFEPFTLGSLTVKNRIMSTAHAPSYAEDGKPKERYQRYHEEKAKGGLGLTMFGGSSNVSIDSPPAFGQINVDADVVPYFREFSERIHRHDCALMIQLTHMGRRTHWTSGDWLPTVAPSRVREPAHRSFPKVIERADIRRIAKDFGIAARRCREGGLDGVEIAALGQLLGQFWSPAVNRRTDEYGGSLENRVRFSLEVLEAIREQVGTDFVVGLRMTMDEEHPEGYDEAEGIEIARIHARSGLVDYINVTAGNSFTNLGLSGTVPGMAHPSAPNLELAKRTREQVGIPVIHACRVADLATADRAIREGCVDLIGMTRAHIADPHLVAKLARDEEERIRPCVGAGYCIDRIYFGAGALCLHNAATGREGSMPQVIEPSASPGRRVVIIGAGPAGLEAARVCASRGHSVVLFEAASEAGGQLLLASRAGWRRDLVGIVRWLVEEVGRLGVDVRYGVYAEEAEILAESPDVVIIATGGVPDTDCVAGAEHVVSVWDVLGGQVAPGAEVLLFDDNGQHPGPSCAEFLAEQGARVELVTPDRAAAQEMGSTNFSIHLRNLYRAGVALTPDTRVTEVRPSGNRLEVKVVNEYSGDEAWRTVDQVVVEHGSVPADDVFHALAPSSVNGGELDLEAFVAGRTSRPVTGTASPSIASATRSRAATCTRRCTTRCACAACSESARGARPVTGSRHDYVIVGAGSAGCVLANRLSADPANRVLLLEAGGEARSLWVRIPAGFQTLLTHPTLNWCFETEPDPGVNGRRIPIPRGRGLGGRARSTACSTSAAQPLDYDTWAQLGNRGWGFEDVLPYFKRAESFERGGDALRGGDGPLNVADMIEPPPAGRRVRRRRRRVGRRAQPRLQRRAPGRIRLLPGDPARRSARERGERLSRAGPRQTQSRGGDRRSREAGDDRGRPRGRGRLRPRR